jgi:hypothetical protein
MTAVEIRLVAEFARHQGLHGSGRFAWTCDALCNFG